MNPFEYVIILTSLILGLGVTQILVGVANLITNKNIKWSLPHSMMTVLVFLTQIQEWWITYTYSMTVEEWSLPLVMLLMIYPILLFVAARVLFPYDEIENKSVDLEAYFWKKWPAIYTIFFLIAITSILQNVLFSGYQLSDQILQFLLAASFLFFILTRLPNRLVHILFLGLQLIVWAVYLYKEDLIIKV